MYVVFVLVNLVNPLQSVCRGVLHCAAVHCSVRVVIRFLLVSCSVWHCAAVHTSVSSKSVSSCLLQRLHCAAVYYSVRSKSVSSCLLQRVALCRSVLQYFLRSVLIHTTYPTEAALETPCSKYAIADLVRKKSQAPREEPFGQGRRCIMNGRAIQTGLEVHYEWNHWCAHPGLLCWLFAGCVGRAIISKGIPRVVPVCVRPSFCFHCLNAK